MTKKQILDDLKYFNSRHQKLIIWKSIDRLDESSYGKTDFDLLLMEGNFQTLLPLLKERGWTKFQAEKWRSFEKIHDFFKIIQDGKNNNFVIHFHIHEEVRTGERFTKSLVLNSKEFENKIVKVDGFETVENEFDNKLKIIRAAFKLTFLDLVLSLIRLNRNSIYKYRNEILNTSSFWINTNNHIFSDYLHEPSVIKFLMINKKIRKDFNHYRQKRTFNNYYFKLVYSKTSKGGKLVKNGFLVSLVGVDGSGKSTIINEINNMLSKQFKTKMLYMGLPKSVKKLRATLYKFKKEPNKKEEASINTNQLSTFKKNRLVNTLFSLLVSAIKLSKNIQIFFLKKRGYIIFTDRYPLDGVYDDLPQWENSFFSNIEKKANKRFILPNKLFLLFVDEKVLELRKPESYQGDYKIKLQTQQDLLKLAKNNERFLILDNSKNLNLNTFNTIKEIFEEVNNDY
tara:strand:+ start:486 stop:1850 length:1365 start_codon:yes stop_codon:yes gene_type:complete